MFHESQAPHAILSVCRASFLYMVISVPSLGLDVPTVHGREAVGRVLLLLAWLVWGQRVPGHPGSAVDSAEDGQGWELWVVACQGIIARSDQRSECS